MRSSRTVLVVALVAALLGSCVGSVAAASGAQEDPDPLNADSIVVNVDVREDGTAEWAIQYKYRLDTPNRTAGFEHLRDRIQAHEDTYLSEVRRDVEQTVRLAENQTGRSMSVGNVTVTSSRQTVPQDYGIIVHEFTWNGFAVDDDPSMRIGDSIRGFWLQTRTRLTITWPGGYEASQVEPEPDERDATEVTWKNPDFGAEEPKIVVERESDTAWSGLTVPGLVLLTVVGAVVAIRRASPLSIVLGSGVGEYVLGEPSRTERTAADGSGDGTTTADASGAQQPGDDAADDGASDADGGADAGSDGAGTDADVPLTNEEQVRRTLERNDGRIKQQEIAERCDWSDSKTSRVVRSLEEQGVVEVFRIGRENVVSSTEGVSDNE